MTAISYKLAPAAARECLAALLESAPWYSKAALSNLLERLDGRGIEVRVDKARRKHTESQRGYYHLCVDILARTIGDSHDGIHDVVLAEAFGSQDVVMGEHVYRRPLQRSAKLGVEDYSILIETLHRCAAFAGVVLPDPQTVDGT